MGRYRLSKVIDLKDKKKLKVVCLFLKMDVCRGESVRQIKKGKQYRK